MKRTLTLAALAGIVGLSGPAGAVTLFIGDVDGFGINPAGLVRATGAPHTTPADTDGNGLLSAGEFLPDWNSSGNTCIGCGDNFDFRSGSEGLATDGAQWTDHSVTDSNGAADGAAFTFTFTVPNVGANDYGVNDFINFVFGDYDVVPTTLDVDGQVVTLNTQGGNQDGLIQMASATVPWTAMLDGQVVITIIAPNEPYLAFDYALLDTDQIADCDGDGIPDASDNCFCITNTDQIDLDHDGVGDACDLGCHTDSDCSDGTACTSDSCDGVTGLCSNPAITCTAPDACSTAVCDPTDGCVITPILCAGNACNSPSCDPILGCQSTPVNCNDNSLCTDDSCNPNTGCIHAPVNCNDFNACTDDACSAAQGCVYDPVVCNDGNVCTADSCDPASGCAYSPVSCDDGVNCTLDSCDPGSGCHNDNQCPNCGAATASPSPIWPPNHKLVSIDITGITDPQGQTPTIRIDGVAQDEPTQGLGSGNTCPDAAGIGTSTAQVRAERSGQGDGRVYHIYFTATDTDGHSCNGEVTVCVPHDQSKGGCLGRGGHKPPPTCGDQGPDYDSLVCQPEDDHGGDDHDDDDHDDDDHGDDHHGGADHDSSDHGRRGFRDH